MHARGFPLYLLAWACALLPFLTTHATYLVAAGLDHVDWCVPYWDACTSISATGRQLPEKFLFKLGMIPAALLIALYWWCVGAWLITTPIGKRHAFLRAMVWTGVLAAGFMVLYTVALGEEGVAFQRMRRTGVTLSFAFTFLAQLLCCSLLAWLGEATGNGLVQAWSRRLLGLLAALLAVGMTSVVLDAVMGAGYDAIEDAFEWVMALMLDAWFAGTALLFARLRISLHVLAPGAP